MGNFSDTTANSFLDHFFGKSTYTPPANIFVGLSSSQPTDAGGNVTEPSGDGYARVQTAPADWNLASGRLSSNLNVIEFSPATAPWLAGANLGYFPLFDAASGGTFLGWGTLSEPKPIGSGDTARFAAGDLSVQFLASA